MNEVNRMNRPKGVGAHLPLSCWCGPLQSPLVSLDSFNRNLSNGTDDVIIKVSMCLQDLFSFLSFIFFFLLIKSRIFQI
jgi:hypothetical protein